jgi:hypothetical protein
VKTFIFGILTIFVLVPDLFGQAGWTQKLDGWLDGSHWPYLYSGGSFYTKVSFVDIDGDGDYDMFFGGGATGSFRLFENIGTRFVPEFRIKYMIYPETVFIEPIRGSMDAEFGDFDGDGDFDVVRTNEYSGGGCRYAYNVGDQHNASWRYPQWPDEGYIPANGPPSLIDINGDGDIDFISGLHDSTIYYFENSLDTVAPVFDLVTNYLGHINIGSTFNLDINDLDADGDYDLIACVTGGINKRYENIGGPGYDSLQWVLVDSNFLGGQYTPDWLECPELVDIDADGDLDLFLAGAYSHLNCFENIGTPQIPQFVHRYDTTLIYNFPISVARATMLDYDRDGLIDIVTDSLFLHNIGSVFNPRWETVYNYVPNSFKKAYCDIDADGDLDILIPWDAGAVLITNTGIVTNPIWDSGHYVIADSHSWGMYSLTSVDIDDDNDYDIIAYGESSLDFIFYRNIGDSAHASFEFVTTHYLGLNTPLGQDPAFVDVDYDGDKDLLISNYWNYDLRSKLFYYENIGTPQQAVWDSVTDDYMGWLSSGLMGHAYLGGGDYDSDGDDDIILSYGRGIMLMQNQAISGIIKDSSFGDSQSGGPQFSVNTYPNPFNDEILFSIHGLSNVSLILEIYNVLGQKIDSIKVNKDKKRISWRSNNNPSGMYLYRIKNDKEVITGKFILIK